MSYSAAYPFSPVFDGLFWAVEFENSNSLDLGQYLDSFQFAVHRTAAAPNLNVDYVLGLFQLFADLIEYAAEFSELGFHCREHLPDFVRMLLDGEGSETDPE